MLNIYLAGAIRDNHPEDIEWREEFARVLGQSARILNPLGGKSFNKATGEWLMNGIPSASRTIVKQDLWCVRKADILVVNFLSLAAGYNSIGTLTEFGGAAILDKLIYTIVHPDFVGHQNTQMYALHPFINENSCAIFNTPESCLAFLTEHIKMLSGLNPHFKGVIA